jgi:hypothetical protein
MSEPSSTLATIDAAAIDAQSASINNGYRQAGLRDRRTSASRNLIGID